MATDPQKPEKGATLGATVQGKRTGGSDGRDSAGRFAPGSSGNPRGRPSGPSAWGPKLREAVRGEVSAERIRAIWTAMEDAAIGGDSKAAKIILDHTIGKRPIMADADGPIELDAERIAGGDIGEAVARVMMAAAEGKLEAAEAKTMIEAMAKAAEVIGFDARLSALEQGEADSDVVDRAKALRAEMVQRNIGGGGSDAEA
ncbi:MAG: DUF5681 domain-containing protein [Planctomycetota bacterium]